jgi:hypothetical protein
MQARNTMAGGPQAELLRLFVEPITWPMSWDATAHAYGTKLRVLLKVDQRQVSPNQDVRVRFSAKYATVQPPDITLRANEPIKDHIVVVITNQHLPAPIVTAESDLGRVQNELAIDLGAPRVKVHAVTGELNGFGLDGTTLVVTSVADDGGGRHRAHQRGRLVRNEQTEINFAFPTLFLFLVIVGGTVGGALNWIRRVARARGGLGMLLLEGRVGGAGLGDRGPGEGRYRDDFRATA